MIFVLGEFFVDCCGKSSLVQGNMDIEKYPKEMIQAAQEYIKACKEEGLSEQQMLKFLDELLEKQQPFCVSNTQYSI